ncbi:hypothetical protein L2K70_02365 [Nocardioides KLBMP 9356]|uniref:Uncharacterized protein n=1 Tax=Nocardioides potassii TaxID=2911371 RepID=A0ABS9H599_9ACTN|nr:hypothetical protein [Nocardioides potassii]MCF6376436.1 hypothetical protein [Nocardioides potassii]
MTEELFQPTIRTQADLESAWRRLMGPWSFGGRSVWMMLIQDDVPLPQLTEITDADEPDDLFRANFGTVLTLLRDDVVPRVSFAFLVSRPGSGFLTAPDRRWAAALYEITKDAGVPCEIVHLGTKGAIRPIPPDQLEPMASSA